MERTRVLLAMLAASNGRPFEPAQLQKAMFLVTENMPAVLDQRYNFQPYNYGPFDAAVYGDAENLEYRRLASIDFSPRGKWKLYSATQEGIQEGVRALNELPANQSDYLRRIADWVLGQDFSTLVKSIYDAYPHMRVNSVFSG